MTLMLLWFSLGCQDKENSCFQGEELAQGTARFEYDGSSNETAASWIMTGSTLQISLESDISRTTIRLQQADDGSSADSLSAEGFPYSFSLGVPELGNATFYPDSNGGTSSTTKEDSPGTLTLVSFEQGIVQACFSFAAVDSIGNSYQLSEGLMKALENEL